MTALRRTAYIFAAALCIVIYLLHRQWLSWLVLVAVLLAPWVSLLMSLPAMLAVKVDLHYPQRVRLGMPAKVRLHIRESVPAAWVECRLRLHNTLTGERYVGTPGEYIPTDHCGAVEIGCDRLYVWDYLGLFRRKLPLPKPGVTLVTPRQLEGPVERDSGSSRVRLWRPKPGGGFAENHELRLYRPGDDLRNIHWKLSAKTGNLIYREAMEPVEKSLCLVITLSGDPDTLDRKLGRLLGACTELLEKGQAHRVRWCHGGGEGETTVRDAQSLTNLVDMLLYAAPTRGEMAADTGVGIGGDAP